MTETIHAGRVLLVGGPTSGLSPIATRLRDSGLDVVPVQSVPRVAQDLARRPASVVVLDSSIPDDDRLDLLERLRRGVATSHIRILWLARIDGGEGSARALESGADDILTHPFDIDALRFRIVEQLAQAAVLRHSTRESRLLARLAEIEDALNRHDNERASLSERIATHLRDTTQGASSLTSDDATPLPASLPAEPRLPGRRHRTLSSDAYKRTAELSMLDASIVREIDNIIDDAGSSPLRLSILIIEPDTLDEIMAQLQVDDPSPVTRQLGALLSPLVRDHDIVRELGRRQLCVLLPHTDEGPAIEVARRLRQHASETPMRLFGQTVQLTISIGIATLGESSDASPFDLIQWAAAAARQAHELGGDRWWIDTWNGSPGD